jgi:SAM-dependent methyltransferase
MGDGPGSGVDLDRLAGAYGHRAVGSADRERAAEAMRAAGLGRGDLAVDVGGGRGTHAEVFAGSGARVLVVDLSPAMAHRSAEAGLLAVVADGHRLPVADRTARLVYFHLSIHHGDPARLIGEAARVAASGGTVWVWTLDPAHHRSSFLARWFPSVPGIDEARFPHPAVLGDLMVGHGLALLEPRIRREQIARTAGDWEEAVRAGFVSTLHLLPPGEIEEGLDRFHAVHPDPAERISYELVYRSVAGRS